MIKLGKEHYFDKMQTAVFNTYRNRTPKSNKIFNKATRCFPGGVSGNVKFYEPYPVYMNSGSGSKQFDVDGNEYVDCHLSNGPLLLGHAHENVMEFIKSKLNRGLLLYNPDYIIECAELLKETIPCAERVRFANSGTEATMLAVKLARAFTNKTKILKFFGHYHGQSEQFLIGVGNTTKQKMSLGITNESVQNTIVINLNDLDLLKQKLDEEDDIAAVILDPQGSIGGIFPASQKFLKGLREICNDRGVVLIFDEVITGFRVALGGAQEYFGVVPDIATYAKALSSGGRFAVVAGREDILATVMPRGDGKKVFQSGTCNDELVGVLSTIATIKEYQKLNANGEYKQLSQKAEKLKEKISKAFNENNIPCHINLFGPSLKIFFTDLIPSFENYSQLDPKPRTLFYLALMNEEVILAWPSAGTTFLSFAHKEQDLQKIIDSIYKFLHKYDFSSVIN